MVAPGLKGLPPGGCAIGKGQGALNRRSEYRNCMLPVVLFDLTTVESLFQSTCPEKVIYVNTL